MKATFKKYKIIILILAIGLAIESMVIIGSCLRAKKQEKIPVVGLKIKAKIAIVLDDWGYNLNNLKALKEIKYPLTLSILPNLKFSKRVSEEAQAAGFEVILHLPMQPHENLRLERNTILTNMNEKTIRGIVGDDLGSIMYAKGVSNHMGSCATEDKAVMMATFRELRQRGLFFLDSFVTAKTICPLLAQNMGVKFVKRDVFLDNALNQQYIKNEIYKLKGIAKVKGKAVGIGHDRKITLEVLKEVMPQLEKEGYRFVFLSELVK